METFPAIKWSPLSFHFAQHLNYSMKSKVLGKVDQERRKLVEEIFQDSEWVADWFIE